MTLIGSAMSGTLEEFVGFYEPGMASNWVEPDGETLLTIALGNTKYRSGICNFLLDEGADASATIRPGGYNCLHILLGLTLSKSYPENLETDLALLKRLLDGGADINAVARKGGTPLQAFSEKLVNLRDESIAVPFYEVLFARPELDLLKIGAFKESTYKSIWLASFETKLLSQYAQQFLKDRDIPVPDLGTPPEPTRSS